jgi:hypothetical protein
MKIRGFSVVLHDVHKGLQTKADVESKVLTLKWRQFVIAEEPYNHQEGSHIHLFLQLENPVHFSAFLKLFCVWWKSGRVQIDQMRGSLAQGCKYVMENHTQKDKYTDPNPIIRLDIKNAKEVGVEATVVTRQEYIQHYCHDESICKICIVFWRNFPPGKVQNPQPSPWPRVEWNTI